MEFKRILVFRTGHLGDTLVAVPAFWALREAFPNSTIALLSSADQANPQYVSARDVLPAQGMFDDWISYPSMSGGVGDIKALLGLALKLRRRKFDAVIYLMTRYRTSRQIDRDRKFFKLAGVSRVIGAEVVRQNNLSFDIPKPIPRIEQEGKFLVRLLHEEGVIGGNARFRTDLASTEPERLSTREWMDQHEVDRGHGHPLIAVGPGSKWDSKIWDEDRYADVVGRLIKEFHVFPIVLGGPEDREKGDRLIARCGRGANAAGELDVRHAAAVLAECRFYLGNDTGTMHLSAAVGTPCIAMFSAVDWAGRFEPLGDEHILFRRSVECEGCHSPQCVNTQHRNKCLDLIGAEEVYEACVTLLSRREHRHY